MSDRRDFKGYFGTEPTPCWPDGARLAVSFVVNVEEGAELSIGDGEVVTIIGPSGSGKTTVLNMISGHLPASAGRIRLGGTTISGLPAHRIAHHGVARTFQLVRVLPSLSVEENVLAAIRFRVRPASAAEADEEARSLLERVGLAGRGGEPASALTYIDQKRMELARALGSRPSLLLLDEWLAGGHPAAPSLAKTASGIAHCGIPTQRRISPCVFSR